jgi:hypothetical protein
MNIDLVVVLSVFHAIKWSPDDEINHVAYIKQDEQDYLNNRVVK